jgi:uncharacterized membrane protein
MKRFIERMEDWLEQHPKLRPWAWFAMLWLGGLLSVATVSYAIRWLLRLD